GHTGNSTAPHLHFQLRDSADPLMDSADPLMARGIPCAFAEYLIRRGGRWERDLGGIPGGSSVSVRSRRLPRRGGRSAVGRLARNGQFWGVVELPAGGGRRVRGGAGCAAALVPLPPAVRRAAAVRAAPYRAG